MFIRLCSDIHLEFSNGEMDLPELPTDKETVLVLAGDIGLARKEWTYVPFLTEISNRFQQVIYVMGNHEHYKGRFSTSYHDIANGICHLPNVDIYDGEFMIIDDVAFVCATFWASMNNGDPNVMWEAKQTMNDYKSIRHGPTNEPWKRKLLPEETVSKNQEHKDFIFSEITKHKEDGRTVVVVTHHAPHVGSLDGADDAFRTSRMGGAYYTECFEDIANSKPDLWLHGHLHQSSDYKIENTRIICNPRGYYPDSLNPEFNPVLLLEV